MVKPTLKPEPDKKDDLKDDKLKAWGIIPAAVVIDDSEKQEDKKDAEAAIKLDNLETEIDESPRQMLGKYFICFAVFTIFMIVSCTVGSFLYFHESRGKNHQWKGWCSVQYGDDNISAEKDHSSSEEQKPFLPTPPRPSGQRQCDQETALDIDEQYERVDRPEEIDCERITILHDYNANISAYRLWNSGICYVTWIESEVLMNPEEFWINMQDPQFLNEHFNELIMMYRTVLPALPTPLNEQEDGKYGEYLDGPKEFLCQGTQTYWIEKIPDEEIEAYKQLIEQVLQMLMQLASNADGEPTDVIDYGGYGGEETDWPWDDQMGNRDGDWPMDGLPDSPHHGWPPMDDDWPMGDVPHGGHDGRKRRSAGKFKPKDVGKLLEYQQKAREAALCLKTNSQKLREIGSDRSVVSTHITAPCVMEEVKKLGAMLNL